ncbi:MULTISPECIES: DUF4260 domain-containing protein [unclassified Bradyrhizobium]|uniref:DUF4260 domain-containing protein n=1 Tax=unclassified Bradyrhizobium TaxID=2631580 RepID=UPI002916532F|nr:MULTISPECIES: DUF4260 domain-containing protein [unclassified Bradyrhizobium]
MSRQTLTNPSPDMVGSAHPDVAVRAPTGSILVLLRLENLALAISAVLAFRALGGGWGLFAVLFLLPDLSMLCYLAGSSMGARCYNLVHTYVAPALLAAVVTVLASALGRMTDHTLWLEVALIWCAHIGVDRALGFGLKYPSSFSDTHLGRLGRPG